MAKTPKPCGRPFIGGTKCVKKSGHERACSTRIPYDADHVHIIDEGHTVTAIWIADPEKAKNPRATYDAPWTYESRDDYETVAEATRYYKSQGATFSGWIIRWRNEHNTEPIPNKKAAMQDLKYAIDAYFDR